MRSLTIFQPIYGSSLIVKAAAIFTLLKGIKNFLHCKEDGPKLSNLTIKAAVYGSILSPCITNVIDLGQALFKAASASISFWSLLLIAMLRSKLSHNIQKIYQKIWIFIHEEYLIQFWFIKHVIGYQVLYYISIWKTQNYHLISNRGSII